METREDVTRLIDEDDDNEVSERDANVVVALEEENLLLKEKKRRKKPSGLTVVIAGDMLTRGRGAFSWLDCLMQVEWCL